MSFSILTTKLYKPVVRPGLVSRSRLTKLLNDGLDKKLTLISAPAGYGKTTLLSIWAAGCERPVAWLTLDEGDNEPVCFWRYVHAALQTVDSRLGKSSRSALFSTRPPALEQVITSLVNDVMNAGVELILVFEDYHLIDNAEIHTSINFLLDHLPPKMHLMVTTRSDPPLHLALRRGRVQMTEIRATDLRFTHDETASFLNQTVQLGLANEDVALLGKRTEGWIVGLQMAAISLQYEPDRHAFITTFSGDDHHIADYLGEEVLQRQPVDFQNFLTRTSFLDRLSDSFCNSVLGREDSQAMLNALERANLFIQPLDNRRKWFRYHPLFAELLRQRLFQTESETKIKELQRRAVDWLNSNGHFDLAVEYALKFSDFELATNLLTSTGKRFVSVHMLNTFLNLAERLPEKRIAESLNLACMLAWVARATGHLQKAEHYIRFVERQAGRTIDEFISHPDDPSLAPQVKAVLIEMTATRARIDVERFEFAHAFHLIENLLPHLAFEQDSNLFALNPPSVLRGNMLLTLGLAQKLHADINLAAQSLTNAADTSCCSEDCDVVALSLGNLGETQALQGYLHNAYQTFLKALGDRSETELCSAFFGMPRVGLGNLFYEWNELDTAARYLQAGIEQGKFWGSWECLLPGYIGLARVQAARQNWKAAFDALDKLQTSAPESRNIVQASAESTRALLNLWKGNLAAALDWANHSEPDQPRDYVLAWENNTLIRCRIWIGGGDFDKIGEELNRIICESKPAGHYRHWLEALCLKALIFGATRRMREALSMIQSALEAAEPEGYIRLFVDEGVAMQKLLSRTLTDLGDRQHLSTYVSKLLSAFEPAAQKLGQTISLIEPLTERETQVLKFIAEGLSNPEIAKRLYLSPNTLKAHTQNIFSKLNVHNRLQAANKARELDLII